MRIVIVGAAGQARENAWYVRAMNDVEPRFDLLGFIVTDLTKLGPADSSQVLGDYEWLRAHRNEVDGIVLGLGNPAARLRVADEITREFPHLEWPSLEHPNVTIDRQTARLGRGILLAAGVVATVNVTVDDFAMLNFGCTLGHESLVGRGSVINPGANVSGGVQVGEGALVGAGAVILQYKKIGVRAVVGAGAVVTDDVPAGTTVVGVPARPLVSKPQREG